MGLEQATERTKSATRRGAHRTTEFGRDVGKAFVNPAFLERRLEKATRSGQFIAAVVLVVLVPLTLRFILIFHRILIRLFLGTSPVSDAQNAPFVVTLVALVMVVAGAWFWFQWVRTAGFGLTNVGGGA